ncbi:hypothetical protein HMPREF0972_01194 [Actinomyces sp. oral taxon 848 str. F0332]|nr:hypothetical protein HMPREF0972_01194 [Actinomyces sp. oral taxon 848 str. F0332]
MRPDAQQSIPRNFGFAADFSYLRSEKCNTFDGDLNLPRDDSRSARRRRKPTAGYASRRRAPKPAAYRNARSVNGPQA